MTDQPDPPADLDSDPVLPVDSLVPGEYRDLDDGFWVRPIRVVKVTEDRL